MALSDIIKNFTDGRLTLIDGTPVTPLELLIPFDNGDWSITGLKKVLNESVAYESRGKIKSLRHTVRRYIAFSGTAMYAEFSEATGTIADFVFAQTAFSARISTADVPGNVDQMHVKFETEGTDLGDAADGVVTIKGVEVDSFDFAEGDPDQFSVSGTGYLDISGDIVAAELT